MAAMLASISEDDELLVSERFFKNIQHESAIKSCGCMEGNYTGEKIALWSEKDMSEDSRFDFGKTYSLRSHWCSQHGQEYCEKI